MGKLNYEPHIQHFSHEHQLELINILSVPQQQPPNITIATTCSGCKERASPGQWIYTCKSCNFNLHIPCSQMPKVINHPSDPNHPLILLPSPAYPCDTFNCDGCGCQKNTGFSYHCTACSLDLHILCATKPLSVNHHAHLAHPLTLAFYPPYETNGFSCDICHKLGMNHWLYRCASCGFDAHISCATDNDNSNTQRALVQQPQPVLQHHYSFPGVSHQPQFMPQGVGHQGIPVINNNLAQPPQQQRLYHANSSPNMDVAQQMMMSSQQAYSNQLQLQQQIQQLQMQQQQQLQQQQGYDMNPQLSQQLQLQQQQLQQLQQLQQQQQQDASGVMDMAILGMFNGASQQLGQSLLQNAMGAGNNNGGGGGGGGTNDIFQSILGGGGGGGGGTNDIFQSILGGGGGGGGGTNDIFQSILGGGGGGGGGTNDIFQSILGGGGEDSSSSLLKIGSQVLGLMF